MWFDVEFRYEITYEGTEKTMTLHVCFVCALMHGCVFGVHNMAVMCCDCLCA